MRTFVSLLFLAACAGGSHSDSPPPGGTGAGQTTPTPPVPTYPSTTGSGGTSTFTGESTGEPLVVFFTADTLGATAANAAGLCGVIAGIAEQHGMAASCLSGGVPPASWTGESHTRMLWPTHRAGALRASWSPACDSVGAIPTLALALGARSIWGADNDVLGSAAWFTPCPDGMAPWHQGVDAPFYSDADPFSLIGVPEADRPAHQAIDAFVDDVNAGSPSVVFLNAFEVGGHMPRCWFDPLTPSCDGLWQYAVEHGIVAADADRPSNWQDLDFQNSLLYQLQLEGSVVDEDQVRPLMWGSMIEKMAYYEQDMLDSRVDRILAAVQSAGRRGDLTLVILGDHGENPCVDRPGAPGLQCSHSGLPMHWSANVPVMVIPATAADDLRAEGLVGDAITPWSTSNLIYGLYDRVNVPIPADWPAPEPVGTATSWTCRAIPTNEDGTSNGLRVVGDHAVQCMSGVCTGTAWAIPKSYADVFDVLDPIPEDLADYSVSGTGNWFEGACAGAP